MQGFTDRPATIDEIAAAYVGRRASFRHAIVEGNRRVRGNDVTTHRERSTALIQRDERGIFAMRKNQRENLIATHYTSHADGKTFIARLRASYLG